MIRKFLAAAVITAAFSSISAHAASFEGPWSVTIITQAGSCDAAYNFSLAVQRGRIISTGSAALSGSVSSGGAVSVSIKNGESGGQASGRLSGNSGSGRWSGVIGGGRCSGRWEASRL